MLGEKILEHGEALPSWWKTAGTTGYDALAEIDRVLSPSAGRRRSTPSTPGCASTATFAP